MFKINDKEIIEFEKDLKAFANKAYPFATKNTVNQSAFHAQKLGKRNTQVKMVLRNKHALQSIRVDQTKTLIVRDQAAAVGSTADYMEDQEFGTVKTKTGRIGLSIPTGYSAGQNGQQPRTRLPRKANKLTNIRLKNRKRVAKNRKQQTLFIVQDAVTSGNRYIYLNLGKKQGIFKVIGGRKGFKRGWPKGAKLKMVHDLSRDSVVIPANPWLKPAVDTTAILIPKFYKKSLIFQLKRHNLFQN